MASAASTIPGDLRGYFDQAERDLINAKKEAAKKLQKEEQKQAKLAKVQQAAADKAAGIKGKNAKLALEKTELVIGKRAI